MKTIAALEPLTTKLLEITRINSAASVLSWDQETHMPAGGGEARAEQIAVLQGLAHDKLVSPEIERFLAATVRGRGTTVLTACCHTGVVNVGLEARRLQPDQPVDVLLGGYHLAGSTVGDRIETTVRDLKQLVELESSPPDTAPDGELPPLSHTHSAPPATHPTSSVPATCSTLPESRRWGRRRHGRPRPSSRAFVQSRTTRRRISRPERTGRVVTVEGFEPEGVLTGEPPAVSELAATCHAIRRRSVETARTRRLDPTSELSAFARSRSLAKTRCPGHSSSS